MSDLDHDLPECGVARFLAVLEGTWATLIVRDLLPGPKRFTELRAGLPGISPKTLSARLRRLEETGLVTRTAYAEVPPRVEYELTEAGTRLRKVLDTMAEWAERDLPVRLGTVRR
ncbi:helix-turn-helix transcriptional regulator [Allokutzneria sp. A3M-2-11 16]|uniref:winged helix-turn-helix transcriptional regulator n=1 Tax=Allokutzneria sp. A3M-2-11 16 TaxID=2962043 RepID=UPI0020B7FAD3|nr:helix-turn-helix domain-containing protein [Allokutzneria sp. A3M-2-11 16]MCP3803902.1 helix-turn-helix transcriptional regulator [Allokutzneria sp. A3M-2-11 16]